ncbi:pilus assembly protein TadG-related protein [Novosphingobium profundi]|uniref:pilus assembly protein TadG-related protein n=1 Tax=Novosphingobium profundi TaxID=1774954 RepID=UPI001FECB3A4|nr:pilus assembly protein TadG-related protein [Novosphingobium profundi]
MKRLRTDRRGGIGLIVGLSLPVVFGSIGLAFDVNRGIEERIVNQRAADMAALAAAMAYKADPDVAVLQPTADDLGRVNGVGTATVTAQVIDDYPSSGDSAVKVTVTSRVPFTLARVLGFTGTYAVTSSAYASLARENDWAAPCFLALSSDDDALTMNGGASINAPNCSVAAVGSIDMESTGIVASDVIAGGGDITQTWGYITANSARYAGSYNYPSYNGNIASKLVNSSTTLVDPWADDATLNAARALLGSYDAIPSPSSPTTSTCGTPVDWKLTYSPSASSPYYSYFNASTATYTVPAGTYCIGSLSISGGLTVKFASGSNIYINSGLSNSGNTLTFGDDNLYVNGGFSTGSSGVTIGKGVLWIGASNTIKFAGTNTKGAGDVVVNGDLSLSGGSTLTMGVGKHTFASVAISGGSTMLLGEGTFVATKGVSVGGGSAMALGTGDVYIGPDNADDAITLSGSAVMIMGDGKFSANGDITTAGGSRIVFGATANHYINGDMKIAGSALFGKGRYTIDGSFVNGTGGTTWPYTSSLTGQTYGNTLEGVSVSGYDMAGVDVTFVLNDTFSLSGGAKTKLVASTSTLSGSYLADLLIDSTTGDNVDWTGGSANDFQGAVHFPNAQIKMAGGNSTSGSGACFTLIANYIKMTGGAAAGTACQTVIDANSGSGNSAIKLVK